MLIVIVLPVKYATKLPNEVIYVEKLRKFIRSINEIFSKNSVLSVLTLAFFFLLVMWKINENSMNKCLFLVSSLYKKYT